MAKPAERSLPANELFEEEARQWEACGVIAEERKFAWGLGQLRCWLHSEGAMVDGVSERLQRYYKAAAGAMAKRNEGWWDELLDMRDSCSACGESFRVENLSFCTHCQCGLGYCHALVGGKAKNGNWQCPICKQGEVVG